ncbi:MAG: flagellar hook-associated protein FlgK [Myxococcota bacterium]
MSMYAMLNMGRTALSTQKLNLSIAGNNIANAATPGYVKQRLEVTARNPVQLRGAHTVGTGVTSTEISRSFDQFTFQRVLTEQSSTSFYGAQQAQLAALESAFNESSTGGLRTGLSDFFTAVSAVSANPEGASERNVVLGNAETVVNRFHNLATALEEARSSLDTDVQHVAGTVNEAAREIALLNTQIAAVEASGGTAGNLRDRREQLVRALAETANITVSESTTGSYSVHIADLVLVQEGEYNTLVTQPDPANSNLSNVLLDNGTVQMDLTSRLSGGSLGGMLQLRDSTLVGYQTELDNLAFTLVNDFNTQHQAGFGLDGVGGRDFFTALGTANNAAALISLDAGMVGNPDAFAASSTATGIPGDNLNAIALYELNNQALVSGTYTYTESALVQSSQVGMDRQTVDTNVEYQTRVLSELNTLQESISGVSTDEEATNLMKFQSAFESAARFISTVQEMMNTLMKL